MEGSFGTQKEHYDLRRVKARTKLTEILYIFFGIHTANVVRLADRIEQREFLLFTCDYDNKLAGSEEFRVIDIAGAAPEYELESGVLCKVGLDFTHKGILCR